MLTHLPHQPWCSVCVPGRSRETLHAGTRTQENLETDEPVVVQVDYSFASDTPDENDGVKILAMINTKTGMSNATVVMAKGGKAQFPLRWLEKNVERSRAEKVILQSDSENSILEVVGKVKEMCPKVVESRQTPVDSHESNGSIERYFSSLHAQVRVMRIALEQRLAMKVAIRAPLMIWLVRQAAWLLVRYQTWHGETPFYRERGSDYTLEICEFGERVWCRRIRARGGRKWLPRWDEGRWLGRCEQSEEHLVMDSKTGEIKRYRTVRRFADSERFIKGDKVLMGLTGVPWNLKGTGIQRMTGVPLDGVPQEPGGELPSADAGVAAPADGGRAPSAAAAAAAAPAQRGDAVPVPTKGGVKCGPDVITTPGCPACDRRGLWGHGFRHSNECRRRRAANPVPMRPAAEAAVPGRAETDAPSTPVAAEPQDDVMEPAPSSMSSAAAAAAAVIPTGIVPDRRRLREKGPGIEPQEKRVRAEELACNALEVLDLYNVDENLEEDALNESTWSFEQPDDADGFAKEKEKEISMLKSQGTFFAMKRSEARVQGYRVFKSGWVLTDNGLKRKARFVAKEFAFGKSTLDARYFAATPSLVSFRLLLIWCARRSFGLTILDISGAFLNAFLPEGELLAVDPAPGFEGSGDVVWCLRKALYGLRGAPKFWQEHLVQFLEKNGFTRLECDSAVFKNERLLVVAHVDDLAIGGAREDRDWLVSKLREEFELKHCENLENPGDTTMYLGKSVVKTERGFTIRTNAKYVQNILEDLSLEKGKSVTTPGVQPKMHPEEAEFLDAAGHRNYRGLVGRLLWLSAERPDIQFAVKRLTQALQKPTLGDWQALKRVGRYLVDRSQTELCYETDVASSDTAEMDLQGVVDADWGGCKNTRRSTSGGIVFADGCLVNSWSRVQQTVACSSCESEFYAMCTGAAEVLFVEALAREMELNPGVPLLATDSSSAKAVSEKPGMPQRMKHMQVRFLHLQQLVQSKRVKPVKINTLVNAADILTKHVSAETLERLVPLLRMRILKTKEVKAMVLTTEGATLGDAVSSAPQWKGVRHFSSPVRATMSAMTVLSVLPVTRAIGDENLHVTTTWWDWALVASAETAAILVAGFGAAMVTLMALSIGFMVMTWRSRTCEDVDDEPRSLDAVLAPEPAGVDEARVAAVPEVGVRMKIVRIMGTQTDVTYTSLRHVVQPRFVEQRDFGAVEHGGHWLAAEAAPLRSRTVATQSQTNFRGGRFQVLGHAPQGAFSAEGWKLD